MCIMFIMCSQLVEVKSTVLTVCFAMSTVFLIYLSDSTYPPMAYLVVGDCIFIICIFVYMSSVVHELSCKVKGFHYCLNLNKD